MSKRRVIMAMSGGVDSSVAAALLVEAGYQVEGLMLRLWNEPAGCPAKMSANRCCTPDQVTDARQVAEILDIPFQTIDVADMFRETVVEEFIRYYADGLTPNPCLVCNRHIRFGFLLQQALQLGADFLATGHYVRLEQDKTGHLQLLKGADAGKDQSYVLYMLNQSHLKHILFPLGSYNKTEIRRLAEEKGLPVANKPDSQDICFLADGDYRRFLRQYAPDTMRPGPIVDQQGNLLGEHQGLPAYTIGQRKGLGISAAQPLFVLAIDRATNTLIVGPKNAIGRRSFVINNTCWVASQQPDCAKPCQVEVKIRYRATPVPAVIQPGPDGKTKITLQTPLSDITPGQAAVFYHGQTCLGGGTIQHSEKDS